MFHDTISLKFVFPYFFRTEEDNIMLDFNYTLKGNLPFQMNEKEYRNTVKEAKIRSATLGFGYFFGLIYLIFSYISTNLLWYSLQTF